MGEFIVEGLELTAQGKEFYTGDAESTEVTEKRRRTKRGDTESAEQKRKRRFLAALGRIIRLVRFSWLMPS
jgi:hypothetical protein